MAFSVEKTVCWCPLLGMMLPSVRAKNSTPTSIPPGWKSSFLGTMAAFRALISTGYYRGKVKTYKDDIESHVAYDHGSDADCCCSRENLARLSKLGKYLHSSDET